VRAAEGSEGARTCGAPVDDVAWRARVFVVRSPMQATHQAAGWETRLRHAETPLRALTPPRGRGKRPLTDDATRVEAMDRVLTAPRVDGLLRVTWDKPVEQPTQDGGRGRGAVQREKRVSQTIRSDITPSARQADTIAALSHRVGWKAGVTQAEHTRRSFQDAVFCSRHAYLDRGRTASRIGGR